MIAVYYLLDPQGCSTPVVGEAAYVGITRNPRVRLSQHLSSKPRCLKQSWVRWLLSKGRRPVLSVRCFVETEDEAFRLEVALIRALRARGVRVKNTSSGGEAPHPTPETRARQSRALRIRAARGERQGHSKLTAEQVLSIRRAKADGRRNALIAQEHGVSVSTVKEIVAGATWRHVNGIRSRLGGRQRTHCLRGHALVEGNVKVNTTNRTSSGTYQRCLECLRATKREWARRGRHALKGEYPVPSVAVEV